MIVNPKFEIRNSNLPRARAFTLIELILAIGVTAIAMIVINAVFFSALRMRENTTGLVDESLPVEQALDTLRHDLQGAMPPSADGILTGDFKVGSVTSVGLGQPVDLEVFTTTGALRESEPWGEVQRVTYQLRMPADRQAPGHDLIRSTTRNLLGAMSPQPVDQWLMGGIDRIEYSCFDGAIWYTSWDSTQTTNLPVAVRVRILLANQGSATPHPIEMLVPIDSLARTNQNVSVDTTGG